MKCSDCKQYKTDRCETNPAGIDHEPVEQLSCFVSKHSKDVLEKQLPQTASVEAEAVAIPPEVKGWNWGAFLLPLIWGLSHRVWLSLLCLIPYINIVMVFVLGAKGNEWAWQNQKWNSIEHFKKTQRTWALWGLGLLVSGIVIFIIIAVLVSVKETVPYVKASGQRVNLINVEGAENPSWGQLEAFLLKDTSDSHQYSYPFYTCGDFAEQLHNNAEESGIRAALVVVEFDEDIPHALNAFETTDKGLVYIDVTGEYPSNYPFTSPLTLGNTPFAGPDSSDKVAYVEIGKPLGFVSLEFANENFSYDYYKEYCEPRIEELSNFDVELENYNADVESYNDFVAAHDLCPSTNLFHVACLNISDYQKANTWEARLDLEKSQLYQEWDMVKGFTWQPMDIVDDVKMYW